MRWLAALLAVVGIGVVSACSDDSGTSVAPSSTAPATTAAGDRFLELQRVRREIDAAMAGAGGAYRSVRSGADAVEVRVRADQATLAADLVARYGDLVAVTLGNFAYPDPAAGPPTPEVAACQVPPTGPTVVSALAASLRLDPGSVVAGADFAGTVTVTNTGPSPVTFESGSPVAAVVVAVGTTDVVAIYDSSIAGVGLAPTLAPGASVEIPVVGGTASCDPALGHALPPGTYDVRVVVPVVFTAGTVLDLVSAPATLTVAG